MQSSLPVVSLEYGARRRHESGTITLRAAGITEADISTSHRPPECYYASDANPKAIIQGVEMLRRQLISDRGR